MTVPDPRHPDATPRGDPGSALDPMPGSRPAPPPLGEVPPPPQPPQPPRPASPDGRLTLVATGREDRRRHVVDVPAGELGDPTGLRGRCGVPVERVVPGLRAEQADCPQCSTGECSTAPCATGQFD